MSKHLITKPLPDGTWGVCSKATGRIIEVHPTQHAADRAYADDKTPEERAARLPFYDHVSAQAGYDAEMLHRLDNGLYLSRADTKTAKRLRFIRAKTPNRS